MSSFDLILCPYLATLRLIVFSITFVLLLHPPPRMAYAQPDLEFQHISLQEGLSQTIVHSILQDRQGFLWFATDDGLNKYDGYEFTVYRHEPHVQNSPSSNRIFSILESRSGLLWIGTEYGLNYFDRTAQSFHRIPRKSDHDNDGSLEPDGVISLHEDKNGTLWVGFEYSGLYRVQKPNTDAGGLAVVPLGFEVLADRFISSIDEDENGVLWVGTNGGLFSYHVETGKVRHFERDSADQGSLTSNVINAVFVDRAENLWVATENALLRFDRETETFSPFPLEISTPDRFDAWRAYILEDSRKPGSLWLTSQNGLYWFDSTSGTFTLYRHDHETPFSLSANVTTALYEDHSGILWIGSRNRGLSKLDQSVHRFTHHKHIAGNQNSLSQNDVHSILEDSRGLLWLGTRGGLNRFDRVSKTFTHYRTRAGDGSSISGNRIDCIYEDSEGRLWIGTAAGLDRFVRAQESFEHFRNDAAPYDRAANHVLVMTEAENGGFWLGTMKGFSHFDPTTRRFRNFEKNSAQDVTYPRGVTCLQRNFDGQLWLGTGTNGLYRFDPETETFTHYGYNPDDPTSLSSNNIWALHLDSRNMLWIVTYGGGLNRFHPVKKTFTAFTAQNVGFPTNNLDSMLADDDGNLWLGTDNGLVRFDPVGRTVRIFNVASGIQSREFHQKSQFKSKEGEMFFGGINGFNSFFPDEIYKKNLVPPKVVIADFRLANTSVPIGSDSPLANPISLTEKLTLTHDQNDLAFEFVALHFTQPENNEYAYKLYAYKLEPYAKEWQTAGITRTASYTNLDPGDYIFRVKAANSDGVWNEEGTAIRITISKPWWHTWWAYSLYAAAFLALGYGLRRYELNRLNLRNRLRLEQIATEKFRELDQVKSRFFANISHEFRTPLTLVLGQINTVMTQIGESKTREKLAVAMRHSRRLLHLVSQLLDLSRLESGSMTLNLVRGDVIPFLKNLVFSFEALAEDKKITLKFECEENEIILDYEPDKLEKIITNLLSNAVKFTPQGGSVTVNIATVGATRPVAPTIEITVTDTGIGIPADRLPHIFDRFYQADDADTRNFEGTGIGLALVKELVELHDGSIAVESEVNRGTKFVIQLPLRQKATHVSHPSPRSEVSPTAEVGFEEHGEEFEDNEPVREPTASDAGLPVILVVEDIRDTLANAYQVAEAADGEEGLRIAQETIPDLIISDVMMPKLDGYAFSKKIREDERTSHIPIIMLTAKAGDQDRITGLQTGVDDYLIKPFNAKELRVRIENLIEMRKRLREKFSTATVIKPNDIAETSVDQAFLKRVLDTIETLAAAANMSASQLHRKLHALIGQSPGKLIRSMRLKRAADLLQQGAANVAEICYQVGFSDQANFTRSFKKQFGVAPSQYKK